ncbi:MAG: DUF7312 domain-containing protein [Halobacteriota archaeon]
MTDTDDTDRRMTDTDDTDRRMADTDDTGGEATDEDAWILEEPPIEPGSPSAENTLFVLLGAVMTLVLLFGSL